MKNNKIKLLFFSFVVTLGVASFLYLNVQGCSQLPLSNKIEDENSNPEMQATLPDIELIKDLLRATKTLVPRG